MRTTPQTLTREEAVLALALIEEEYLELVDALFPDLRAEMHAELSPFTPVEKLKRDDELANCRESWALPFEFSTRYAPDLVAAADAVADLDVVVNGCGIRHGLDMQALSREVFASNMSKLGADGKPLYREDGKILKGPDFREPDIAGVLGIEMPA